jgi:membrane protein
MNLKGLWMLFKDTFVQWSDDNPFQLAAALAFYTLFSMAPLLLVAIAVAGLVFGREASQNQIIGVIEELVGVQSARAIQSIVESAGKKPDSGFFASAMGMIFLLLGAGGVVGQLQASLNTIWRVVPKTGRGIVGFLQDRLISYSMVLSGLLLLVSLVKVLTWFWNSRRASLLIAKHGACFCFSFPIFFAIHKFVPDVRISGEVSKVHDLTAILAGKFLIFCLIAA